MRALFIGLAATQICGHGCRSRSCLCLPCSTLFHRLNVDRLVERRAVIDLRIRKHVVRGSISTHSSQRDQAVGAPPATCQLESGLRFVKAGATLVVFGPRSFSYTTPSSVTMKVMIPDDPYSAGYATKAKPALFLTPAVLFAMAVEFPVRTRK
jgi:hypothetical protein